MSLNGEESSHEELAPKTKWYPGKYVGVNNKKNNRRSQSFPPQTDDENKETVQNIESNRNSMGATKDPLWYPGKLVGLKNRRKSKILDEHGDEVIPPEDDDNSLRRQTTWSTYDGEHERERTSSVSNWLRSFSSTNVNKNNDLVEAHSSEHDQTEHDDNDNDNNATKRTESTSGFSNWFRRKDTEASTADTEISESSEKEETKKESIIAKTIRAIRNKFIDRKLQGKILIYRISGMIATAVTCEILSTDKKSYVLDASTGNPIPDDLSDLSFTDRRALSMTDTILNSLERRSRAWDGVDFCSEILLTRGCTIGVSDPFIGIIGFSIQIDVSATVTSLLASRKRYESRVKYEKENGLRGESFLSRSVSFSFSSRDKERTSSIASTTTNKSNSNSHNNGSTVEDISNNDNNVATQPLTPLIPVVLDATVKDILHSIELSDDEDGTKEV